MPEPASDPFERLGALLASIKENSPTHQEAEKAGREEEKDLMNALTEERARAELSGLIQDIGERKKYASKVFYLIVSWIAGVFILLVFQGFFSESATILQFKDGLYFQISFKLSDGVLIAVVGGTTASVIGIFVVVANYLFPKR